MHTLALEWQALWRILLTSLLLGAGLPALFAVGIRAQADGSARNPAVGRAVGYLCFGLVVLVVLLGIAMIVASGFGKALDFSSVYPTLRDK